MKLFQDILITKHMAKHESEREDLMREAVALVRRVEMSSALWDSAETVVAGFYRDGRLAVYFGQDPMFQFDDQHRLRRAYVAGFLYRTQGHTLARLERNRLETETQLLRHDLIESELEAFRQSAISQLSLLKEALTQNAVQVLAQIPEEDEVLKDLQQMLSEILNQSLPLAPVLKGKR